MAEVQQRKGRWPLLRWLLRFLADGLTQAGYAMYGIPPVPVPDESPADSARRQIEDGRR